MLDDGYDARHDHDIALVVLVEKATLNDLVKVFAISWDSRAPPCGSVGVVAGWGLTQYRNYSELLQSIELPYLDHDSCYNLLENDDYKRLMKPDMFCAGYLNYGRSVCQGDSGGGYVVVDKQTNVATLRGIVRSNFSPRGHSIDKCYTLFYTGFTNIGEVRYLTWIRRHIGVITCPPVLKQVGVHCVACLQDGHLVDCTRDMTPGSLAVLTCSHGFLVGNKAQDVATCLSSGSWSSANFTCVPATVNNRPPARLTIRPPSAVNNGTRVPVNNGPHAAGYKSLLGLGNLYKLHLTALTWPAAKTACESEGSHLVILNSEAEYRAVREELKQNQEKIVGANNAAYAWVGVRESDTRPGEYFTVLGQPLTATGFSRWRTGEPDNLATLGDYVQIYAYSDGLGDLRASLNHPLPFTCEREVG